MRTQWLERNALGACPRPGLLSTLDGDLAALRKVGITHIVSLEELERISAPDAAAHEMTVLWHSIDDMSLQRGARTNRDGDSRVLHLPGPACDRSAAGHPVL